MPEFNPNSPNAVPVRPARISDKTPVITDNGPELAEGITTRSYTSCFIGPVRSIAAPSFRPVQPIEYTELQVWIDDVCDQDITITMDMDGSTRVSAVLPAHSDAVHLTLENAIVANFNNLMTTSIHVVDNLSGRNVTTRLI